MLWLDMLTLCAPTVAQTTMQQVVMVESAGKAIAVHVNGLAPARQPHPSSTAEAIAEAKGWIELGYSVDLGLTQINNRNLPALHMTIDQVLGTAPETVCANLAGGSRILTADYGAAVVKYGEGQGALVAALSAYNTGDFARGIANGYVSKYLSGATIPVAITKSQAIPPSAVPTRVNHRASDIDTW